MNEKKSTDYYIDMPEGITKKQVMAVVARAAEAAGLYISHIGGYSRNKYPGSVHWHFKRNKTERGIIDATFWDIKSLFWLMVQNRNAPWVKAMVPRLRKELKREFDSLAS